MLKAELEKKLEDNIKEADNAYRLLHDKSMGDVKLADFKAIYISLCKLAEKPVPSSDDGE